MNALVIGAGPAGLAAAESLVSGGASVTVVEASGKVGGRAASFPVGKHWADLGPHRLHQEASKRVKSLLGQAEGLQSRQRAGRIHLDGKSVRYPLSPRNTLRGLGLKKAFGFGFGALLAGFQRDRASYAGEAVRRVGQPVFQALYAPAARKIWGRDPASLDAEQARSRISAGGPLALLARVFGGGEPGKYLYPAGGVNGMAYQAWAQNLEKRGVHFLFNARAQAVLCTAGRVSGVRINQAGQPVELFADRVVSTLSLPRLLKCLEPAVPSEAPGNLPFRTVIGLHIVLARRRLSDCDVHYFPDEETPFARMSEQSAFGRAADAPQNETVICLDFYDDPGGKRATMRAEELLELALPHLAQFEITPSEIKAVSKVVANDAYPVFEKGYQEVRASLLHQLAGVEGLLTTGGAGLFLHVNQHHAIEMGLLAGEVALHRESVSATWLREAQQFERCQIVD